MGWMCVWVGGCVGVDVDVGGCPRVHARAHLCNCTCMHARGLCFHGLRGHVQRASLVMVRNTPPAVPGQSRT